MHNWQTSSTNTLNRHHHQTHNIHNIADIFRKNILNRCTSSPNTQHTHLQTSSPNTQYPRQQKSSTNMFHTAYTSTVILTKPTLPTSTENFNKHVPHINRHPVQVHSNFQFTPKLASSHREWSFSTAILINQGSSSQGKTSGCQTPQTPQTYPKQFHQTTSQDPHSESSPGNVLVSVNNSGFPQACLPWYSPVSCKEC